MTVCLFDNNMHPEPTLVKVLKLIGFHENSEFDLNTTRVWTSIVSHWMIHNKDTDMNSRVLVQNMNWILDHVCIAPLDTIEMQNSYILFWKDTDLIFKYEWCEHSVQQAVRILIQTELLTNHQTQFKSVQQSALNRECYHIKQPSHSMQHAMESYPWRISMLRAFVWVIMNLMTTNPSLSMTLHQSILASLTLTYQKLKTHLATHLSSLICRPEHSNPCDNTVESVLAKIIVLLQTKQNLNNYDQ